MKCMSKHVLYENAPARVEIKYTYDESKSGWDSLTEVDTEVIDIDTPDNPILYCECGEEFEFDLDSAIEHIQQTR